MSLSTLRPQIDSLSLREALAEVEVIEWGDHSSNAGAEKSTPELNQLVQGVTVDSSDVEPNWIFVAIPGLNRHGIDFSADAIRGGARIIVTDTTGKSLSTKVLEDLYATELKGQLDDVTVISVEDPRKAAAQISKAIYRHAIDSVNLVSVTGTNGKTTTTYLIRAALTPSLKDVGVMGTLEIDVTGEALASHRTTSEAPIIYRAIASAEQSGRSAVVIESSAHALSLNRVDGLYFDSVVFTNLQHDHLDYYQTMDRYFAAKADLFSPSRAKQGVVCVDDEWGLKLAETAEIPIQTFSALEATPEELIGSATHWQVADAHNDEKRWGVGFNLVDPQGLSYECFCPIPGLVNVQNAAAAIISATQLGVPLASAIEGVANARSIPGRMEIVPSNPQVRPRVLVDYAHTPEALQALLDTLRPLVSGKLILVFGTDGDRDATKREELARIAANNADILWITDENPRWEDAQSVRDYLLRGVKQIRPDLQNVTEVVTCRRDAVREAIIAASPGDLVAITGKGAEREQEFRGVYHVYSDSLVAQEVLNGTLPR